MGGCPFVFRGCNWEPEDVRSLLQGPVLLEAGASISADYLWDAAGLDERRRIQKTIEVILNRMKLEGSGLL